MSSLASDLIGIVFNRNMRTSIDGGDVGVVQLDATVNEAHERSAAVTQHPVEQGVNITDHVRPEPATISIDGVVSGTPLVNLSKIALGLPANDAPDEAWKTLLNIWRNGATVTVTTSLHSYENMVITSLTVRRDASLGKVLSCSIKFTEIIRVSTQAADVPTPVEPSQAKKKSLGKKPAQTPDIQTPDTQDSGQSGLYGALSSLFGGG